MKPIIEINNLSKKYRIGSKPMYSTLRDSIAYALKNPLSQIKIRKVNSVGLAEDEFWAIKNISFKVNEGDVIGIIGRNGAGKSTLLKLLSRITPPTKGEIILRGKVASLLEVGTGFHLELTGRENIFLNGAILGMSRREIKNKFDEIVDFAEIEKFLDTPVKHYSSGMYMRLAFAVAAFLESEILIVDEVLAVGDMQFQKKCLGKMQSVAKQGRTVLFVSHNIGMIKALCTKAMLLDQGKKTTEGSTDEVINKYMSAYERQTGNGKTNLKNFPRSTSSQKAIQESWLEDRKGEVVSQVLMGSRIKICFHFKADRILKDPGFGCNIFNIYGQRAFSLANYLVSNKRYKDIMEGTVEFDIPELPLLPGKYVVSFGLAEGKSVSIDYLELAMEFTVLPNDIFRTGQILESGHGLVYVKGNINVTE